MNYLTKDQLRKVFTIAKRESVRDWLMMAVGYNHGLRASEVCCLEGRDIMAGFLTIRRGKGSRITVQELREHDDELLNERAALEALALGNPGRLFNIGRIQFYRRARRYCEMAGLQGDTRTLKHSIATHAFFAKVPLPKIQQHLGHVNINSTLRYIDGILATESTSEIFSVV